MKDKQMIETEARADWQSDPDLRAEFGGDFDRYVAFALACERGQVRVYSRERRHGD